MNKKEMKEAFEKNVDYIRRNIPPDDVYIFAEQTFMAAFFFMQKWSHHVDVRKECLEDPVTNKWFKNIIAFHRYRANGQDAQFDLGLDGLEEDEDCP